MLRCREWRKMRSCRSGLLAWQNRSVTWNMVTRRAASRDVRGVQVQSNHFPHPTLKSRQSLFCSTRKITRSPTLKYPFKCYTKNSTRASRSKTGTISKVIEALEDVEQFEDVSKGLQIKEFLSIARDFLQKMVRAASIKDSVMSVIYKISDFTYVVSCSSE